MDDPDPEQTDWARVTFTPVWTAKSAELQALRSALEAGRSWPRVAVATFAVDGLTSTMAEWMQHPRGDDLSEYVARLIRQPALAEAIPTFAPPTPDRRSFDNFCFTGLAPLLLAGSIAQVVADGGAYDDGPPMATALAITQRWLAALFQSRCEDLRVAEAEGAWNVWFNDVMPSWDRTWLVTDIACHRATLLCITDTD